MTVRVMDAQGRLIIYKDAEIALTDRILFIYYHDDKGKKIARRYILQNVIWYDEIVNLSMEGGNSNDGDSN